MRRIRQLGAAVTLWQVAVAVREHWRSVPQAHRERFSELATKSRLRPANLSQAEQAELRQLLAGMRLPALGRQLAALASAHRRRR